MFQAFTPDASTLIAPVAAGTTSYSDTSEVPTPASSPQPFGNAFYYMVAAKTQDGQVIPGPVEVVRLPKAGYTQKIINASGATTLSKAQPTTAEQHLTGQPWLAVGDDSFTFGVTRTVVNYPSMSSAGIPASATVTDAELKLWGWYNDTNGSATFDAHALTQSFDPATATWNNASAGTAWTTAGGAFSATVTGSVSGLTNDPNRELWPVTPAVQGWVSTPSSEHGLLVKESAESATSPQEQELFLDTSATEPALRPELVVTYLDTTPEDTYYVPGLPAHLTSATTYTVPVTVTNTTGTTLSKTNWALSYHWTLPDGTDVSDATNQLQTALPSDLAPGDTVTIASAQLKTPDTSASGNIRTAYSIGWDLKNTSTGTWLSGTNAGVPTVAPLNQPASVAQPGSNLLGLEKFYQYTGVNTGSGTALLNNAANGNVVWSYNPFSNPSRGFATFVRLAYNSMDTSDSSMGFGWSLQASTLMRLGTPLDFHPNPNPTTVTLTDGDGTSHWFTWNSTTSQWQSPPGLHYFLQQPGQCTPDSAGKTENPRAWLLTRPDRTQFWFDCQGYQTAVIDRNGNEADFTYTERNSANKPLKFLDYITDPTGRQTLTISYYAKGDNYSYIDANGNVASGTNLTNPKIIDEVKSVTDISGRTITFLYTTQGLMAQMTDGDGTTVAKVFKFGYDMTQGNKNVKLVSVTDPRSNPTGLAYYTAPQDPKFKWSLETITDRRGGTTGFAYTEPATGQPTGSVQTVATDQRGNNSTYAIDPTGRPVTMTNAKAQTTTLAWDADNNVTSLTEDNGAKTTWTYDPSTGYPLTMTDAQANHNGTAGTTYTYQTGLNGHIADLISLLTPQQRLWTFGYDANGNLTSVTDPDGNATGATAGSYTTKYAYDTLGDLTTATDADGNPTAQGCSAPTEQRYTGCNPTLPPPSFIGGAPSFLAGIGGSFVSLLDLATTASNPSQGMMNMATGHTYSAAYTGWLNRHGVPTGLNSEYGAGFGTGAVLQAAAGLFAGGGEASAAADVGAPEDASLAARAARAAADCGGMSFTAGTKVLLASGLAVPIASLKPGEKVLATNTRTGKRQAEPVTAVLVHHDTNRYNLTVKTADGSAVIHTTSSHLFWDQATGHWVKAAALRYGTQLRVPGGGTATAGGGYAPKSHAGWMWDLTVATDHDFYIDTAAAAVLVHNCPLLKTYQTYTKENPETGQVYAGRTSGYGTPLENIAARDYGHEYNDLGFGPAQLDQSSESYLTIRGREQMLIEYYRAQGISANVYNGIRPTNPDYGLAIQAATNEFGPMP